MVVFQASNLNLPQSSSSSFISSLLFHPPSLSLALMHSDSSFSLYPSLPSPFSSPSLPPPQTIIPPPTSSATFLHLQNPNPNPNPNPNSNSLSSSRHLFLTSSPLLAGSSVLLRFYILHHGSPSFSRARVLCTQKDLQFDDNRFGVVFAVNHGLSVKLVGSINVFAMHSVSNRKIWVFAVKMVDDEVTLKLMRCAVIDCCVPVFSISLSFGFLLLGEENGVRVFPLRPLVKGRVKKQRKLTYRNSNGGWDNDGLEINRLNVPNGVIQTVDRGETNFSENSIDPVSSEAYAGEVVGTEGARGITCNGQLEENIEQGSDKVKSRSVKLRQGSTESGACFVALRKDVGSLKSTKIVKPAKAVSIQALSPTKILILDSVGDLHLLCLSNVVHRSETPCHMMQLNHSMRVQKLAVLSDISTRSQIIWTSDGHHSVHIMIVSDIDAFIEEHSRKDCEERPTQFSVEQAIFTSEKVQEIIPMSTHAVLILGQGSISAYGIC